MNDTTRTSENTEQNERLKGIPFGVAVELRDYFAAAALQGELAAQSAENGNWTNDGASKLAEWSYLVADAMLAERVKIKAIS